MIRELESGDFAAIKPLMLQLHVMHAAARPDIFRPGDFFSEEDFGEILSAENRISLVYEEGGLAEAFCFAVLKDSKNPVLQSFRAAFIEDIFVSEGLRGRGIGKALFSEAKKRAAKAGAASVELKVWSFNTPAIEFYKSLGMKEQSISMEIKL